MPVFDQVTQVVGGHPGVPAPSLDLVGETGPGQAAAQVLEVRIVDLDAERLDRPRSSIRRWSTTDDAHRLVPTGAMPARRRDEDGASRIHRGDRRRRRYPGKAPPAGPGHRPIDYPQFTIDPAQDTSTMDLDLTAEQQQVVKPFTRLPGQPLLVRCRSGQRAGWLRSRAVGRSLPGWPARPSGSPKSRAAEEPRCWTWS